MCHDAFVCVPRRTHACLYVTWLSCVPRRIHLCDTTHQCVMSRTWMCHSPSHVWRIHACDMTRSWYDTFARALRCTHAPGPHRWRCTPSTHMQRAAFTRVTWKMRSSRALPTCAAPYIQTHGTYHICHRIQIFEVCIRHARVMSETETYMWCLFIERYHRKSLNVSCHVWVRHTFVMSHIWMQQSCYVEMSHVTYKSHVTETCIYYLMRTQRHMWSSCVRYHIYVSLTQGNTCMSLCDMTLMCDMTYLHMTWLLHSYVRHDVCMLHSYVRLNASMWTDTSTSETRQHTATHTCASATLMALLWLRCTATYCSTLQHTATYCNTHLCLGHVDGTAMALALVVIIGPRIMSRHYPRSLQPQLVYVCIYTHTHVHIYIYVYTHTYIYMYIYI